jgi:transposase-like protein
MDSETKTPKTLMEAIRYFGEPGVAREYLAGLRWPDGAFCVKCGLTGEDVYFMASQERWKCRGCKAQWSVKVGTIMEDSAINLDKWMCAIWMVANCKNGVSSYEIHRALGVTQKSAWFMLHRIRLAMKSMNSIFNPIKGGPVEVDETFIGGKITNMSNRKRRTLKAQGRNYTGKAVVMGILERHGEVRARVVLDTKAKTLQREVRLNVERGATVYTDGLLSYLGLKDKYIYETVDHIEEYVRGEVHTNGIENFWSLLKRSLMGTYVNVEPAHLEAYVDEQAFRFNQRKKDDGDRLRKVAAQISGRRLTYEELIGAEPA